MARGGGGFGGGRIGGGGFGGFRGGGSRGGSPSFRVGNVRSSGRPFGRSGANRMVARSPRGSNYYGHHNSGWYGPYFYPWYRRHYWFWGYPYSPWFYSPVYVGSGIALFAIFLLIFIPVLGLFMIPFPGASGDVDGVVTYRDTQTLSYNEYWYEKEKVSQGSEIQYSAQAQSPVTFLIWNQPFESFPLASGTRTGSFQDTILIKGNDDYQYLAYFMRQNDMIEFAFQVLTNNTIEFFIADANDLNRWNNWENISPRISYTGSEGYNGSFSAPYAQDWYLVWYNTGTADVQVSADVSYGIAALDFNQADVFVNGTENVPSSTYTVPTSGEWYFFIYFDPFVNPAASVDITFDVSFSTGVTSNQRWADFAPILGIIALVIITCLVVAVYQRGRAKKAEESDKVSKSSESSSQGLSDSSGGQVQATMPYQAPSPGLCHRCQAKYQAGDVYCNHCGAKLVGRDYGISKSSTPYGATNCMSCGEPIESNALFCKDCGTKVDQQQ